MSDSKDKGGKFLLGAALGAVAGAIAGIVMAPKSGEETRKDIKDAGSKAVKSGKEAGCKVFDRFKKKGEKCCEEKENWRKARKENRREKSWGKIRPRKNIPYLYVHALLVYIVLLFLSLLLLFQ